jgi:hypothetical protein
VHLNRYLCSENPNWNSFIVVVYVCVCFGSEGKLRFFCALEAFHLKFQFHTKLNQHTGDMTFYKTLKHAEILSLKDMKNQSGFSM